jgi:hypothetical protein
MIRTYKTTKKVKHSDNFVMYGGCTHYRARCTHELWAYSSLCCGTRSNIKPYYCQLGTPRSHPTPALPQGRSTHALSTSWSCEFMLAMFPRLTCLFKYISTKHYPHMRAHCGLIPASSTCSHLCSVAINRPEQQRDFHNPYILRSSPFVEVKYHRGDGEW